MRARCGDEGGGEASALLTQSAAAKLDVAGLTPPSSASGSASTVAATLLRHILFTRAQEMQRGALQLRHTVAAEVVQTLQGSRRPGTPALILRPTPPEPSKLHTRGVALTSAAVPRCSSWRRVSSSAAMASPVTFLLAGSRL